jgi:hypothetical protein
MMLAIVMAHDHGMTWAEIVETTEAICEQFRQQVPHCPVYKAGLWRYEKCRAAYRYYQRILKREPHWSPAAANRPGY